MSYEVSNPGLGQGMLESWVLEKWDSGLLSKPLLTGKSTNDIPPQKNHHSNIPAFQHEAKTQASKKLIPSIGCRNSETFN
jgi:hypothetical protein